ncbi:heterodimeric methylmalonyl-CoA mutase small subunit [Algoriphagus boseongensis]|uniref:Heterodimeric methylmalonyl-CoA mutase small subunit n=1 Tax=Algoriphagus boseongensis TaxID=1442587 RepID=A0A4R6T1R4_9BACT|nr:methylmalonyl-CoA mutase family protein [Algoriphagus boseongensis]TDQ15150.1 heterodimeric methylmalonyl-CoA mutase small subunit [Algoriphagus boseongensis]
MNELFSEFDSVSKEEWIAQAKKDLRGKDFDQNLKSALWDRLAIDPFYTLEDRVAESFPTEFQAKSEIPGLPPRIWGNVVSVLPGDTNSSILNALENGADGLVLHLNGFENLDELVKGVFPEYISIWIKPIGNPLFVLNTFLGWIEKIDLDPEKLQGGFLWTPSDLVFEQNEVFQLGVELFTEIFELTDAFPNFKAFALKSSRYSESGANPLDALIFTLGELIEIIDQAQIKPEKVFKKALLEVSIGDAHFGEIARLKTFREIVSMLAGQYEVELESKELSLFSQTSDWSKSILDINTNLIRQTYEAMAGVFGGANFLWVRPFEEENCTEQERRIARNVSLILRDEAYLDKMIDPAAGSYYLEKLQEKITQEIQSGLLDLEKNGGWMAALNSGEIHSRVRAYREKIQNKVLDKNLSKIGANKYPASEKLRNDYPFHDFEEKSFELKPTRATYLFELLNQQL